MVAALNLGSASPFLGSNSPSKPKVIQTNLSNASPQVANLTITKTNSNSSVVTPVNQQVSDVLSNIAGTNAQIDNFSHIDWSSIARESGAQVANQDRLGLLQAIRGSEIADAVDSSRLGLPANVSILPNGGYRSRIPTTTVNAFTFSDGGSTYSVTPSPDGTLIGTKDGQVWDTWQLNNQNPAPSADSAGANVALQTLNSAEKFIPGSSPNLVVNAPKLNIAI